MDMSVEVAAQVVEEEKIKSQNLTIAIPRNLYNWIAAVAEREEKTKSQVILDAVRVARAKENAYEPGN